MCQHWREERTQVVFGRERATSIYTETRYSSSSGNRKKNQILKLKPIRSARLSRVCIIATQLNLSNQKKKKHPQYAANLWYCGEQRVSDSPKKVTAKKKKGISTSKAACNETKMQSEVNHAKNTHDSIPRTIHGAEGILSLLVHNGGWCTFLLRCLTADGSWGFPAMQKIRPRVVTPPISSTLSSNLDSRSGVMTDMLPSARGTRSR